MGTAISARAKLYRTRLHFDKRRVNSAAGFFRASPGEIGRALSPEIGT